MENILHSRSQCDLTEGRYERFQEYPNELILCLHHGQRLTNIASPFKRYQVTSLTSWAIKIGQCPIHTTKLAADQAQQLHFIFALGVFAHDETEDRTTFATGVRKDQRVRFEGRFFKIVEEDRDNLGLVEIMPARSENPMVSRPQSGTLITQLLDACEQAEAFMAGFEDDDLQDGINDRLKIIRDVIRTTYDQ